MTKREISNTDLENFSGETIFKEQIIINNIHKYCKIFKIKSGYYRWYKFDVETWENYKEDQEIFELMQKRYIKHMGISISNTTAKDLVIEVRTERGSSENTIKRHSESKIIAEIEDNETNMPVTFILKNVA